MQLTKPEPYSAWGRNGAFKPHSITCTPLKETTAHPSQVSVTIYSKRSARSSSISFRLNRADTLALVRELRQALREIRKKS